jgi:hypothetical protein
MRRLADLYHALRFQASFTALLDLPLTHQHTPIVTIHQTISVIALGKATFKIVHSADPSIDLRGNTVEARCKVLPTSEKFHSDQFPGITTTETSSSAFRKKTIVDNGTKLSHARRAVRPPGLLYSSSLSRSGSALSLISISPMSDGYFKSRILVGNHKSNYETRRYCMSYVLFPRKTEFMVGIL